MEIKVQGDLIQVDISLQAMELLQDFKKDQYSRTFVLEKNQLSDSTMKLESGYLILQKTKSGGQNDYNNIGCKEEGFFSQFYNSIMQ